MQNGKNCDIKVLAHFIPSKFVILISCGHFIASLSCFWRSVLAIWPEEVLDLPYVRYAVLLSICWAWKTTTKAEGLSRLLKY